MNNIKEEVLDAIKRQGIVAIIRTDNQDKAENICDALIKGNIRVIEFSYTMPFANDLVYKLSRKYGNSEILIGAGTILDPETAKTAITSGAKFIISPYLSIETVRLCNRYRIVCIPGAMTVKEVGECLETGADIVKVFPSELFGPAIIKAIKGPLPHAPLMPTGGVTLENIDLWFDAGAEVVGIGNSLVKGANTENYGSITELALMFVEKIKKIKDIKGSKLNLFHG